MKSKIITVIVSVLFCYSCNKQNTHDNENMEAAESSTHDMIIDSMDDSIWIDPITKDTVAYSIVDSVLRFKPTVQIISQSGFAEREDIRKVIFPRSLIKIGGGAFYGCTNLRAIEFDGDSCQKIAQNAFLDCINLRYIQLPCVKFLGDCFDGCKNITEIHLPHGGCRSLIYSLEDCVYAKLSLYTTRNKMTYCPTEDGEHYGESPFKNIIECY